MELYDFLRLSQAERAEHVYHHGIFLASCQERGNLYNMGGFYAELVYNSDLNEIEEVRGFRTISGLDPYLDAIAIEPNV